MPISFHCPHCNTEFNIAPEYAGKSGPCAACGEHIVAPKPPGERVRGFSARVGEVGWSAASFAIPWVNVLAAVAVLAILAAILIPAIATSVESERRSNCSNNLRYLALASHTYHDIQGHLPAASVVDDRERALYGWRFDLLPFLYAKSIYDQYDQSATWNSPHNAQFSAAEQWLYHCPSEQHNPLATNYVVTVGPPTAFPSANEQLRFDDITDGTGYTLLIEETTAAKWTWIAPFDLQYETMPLVVNPGKGIGISSRHSGGAHAARCDGSVSMIDNATDPHIVDLLLMRNDGVPAAGEIPERRKRQCRRNTSGHIPF